jgi:hypothetical protein
MSIPIIGQPKVGDWSFNFVLTCPCGQASLFTWKPGAILTCTCRRMFALRVPVVTPDGQLQVPLAMREPGVGE